jgi:hypothetical protein
MISVIIPAHLTIADISIPNQTTTKACYCCPCGKWISTHDIGPHREGKKHLHQLNGNSDQLFTYTQDTAVRILTTEAKISSLIHYTVAKIIDNVKEKHRKIIYSNAARYTRYTGLDLFEGISSVEKLIEHQIILLGEMDLPDITSVNYSDGDSCPYGCSNHSFEPEANMLARVEGLKVAMHILITNFGKDIADKDINSCTPSTTYRTYHYYEDPRWCVEYYKTIAAADEKAETERAIEAQAAMSAYSKAMAKTRLAEQARMLAQDKEYAEKAAKKAAEKKAKKAARTKANDMPTIEPIDED